VLNRYLRDAHAMEMNVHQMLVALIATTKDPGTTTLVEQHQSQTEAQIQRLGERLQERGENTSTPRDAGALATAFFKGLGDVARKDKASKNARDGYVMETLEIASYQLLEGLAQRAGDIATADVAKTNRAEEEAMRDALDANWDRAVDLVIAEEGITVSSRGAAGLTPAEPLGRHACEGGRSGTARQDLIDRPRCVGTRSGACCRGR
jgi:ferritin-like metal-binding protein YciE